MSWGRSKALFFRGLALAILVGSGALAPTVEAQTPPDVVELRDGSFMRGTIMERIEGQYVLLQMPSGESRRFEWAVVA